MLNDIETFLYTNFLHSAIRVFMGLLTPGMGKGRKGGPEGQLWMAWGRTSLPLEKELHSHHLAPLWVGSPCPHSARFCQLGQPRADLLGCWVATVAQKADTGANFMCCKKQEDLGLLSDHWVLLHLL